MTKLLIYGIKQQAQQLCFYVENEGCAQVAAFVVDPGYQTVRELNGHPVVTFEEALEAYPPEEYQAAVSFAYQHMMHDRREKLEKCRQAGYPLFTFVSRYATVFADSIGEGNIIYPGCNIAYGVTIGDGNFFETGVTVAHHTKIGNYNFFAPASAVCGDVTIGEHNFFGAHSTVLNSQKIGCEVLLSAGTVLKSAEDHAVYFAGNAKRWHGTSADIKIK